MSAGDRGRRRRYPSRMEILEGRVGTLKRELGCRQYRCQVNDFVPSSPSPFLRFFCVLAFSDALRLNSNSPDALSLRGLVLFLSGRLPQALQHATSALRLDPGHEPAQRLRKRVKDVERLKEEGNSAFKIGKLQDAWTKYSECLDVRCLSFSIPRLFS